MEYKKGEYKVKRIDDIIKLMLHVISDVISKSKLFWLKKEHINIIGLHLLVNALYHMLLLSPN